LKRVQILFVNYEYPPLGGGGGVVNAWLAEELARRHSVTVLTSRAFDLPATESVRNVEVIRAKTLFRTQHAAANIPSMASFLVSGVLAGRHLLNRRTFDIINTHFAVPTGPVGMSLSRYSDIPNVLSVHGGDLYDPSKWTSPHRHRFLRATVRKVAEQAAAVVGQSRNTNENLNKYYTDNITPELIPLGIPRPGPPKSTRTQLGIDSSDVVLVTVGRLVARKGTEQLIRLLKAVDDQRVRLVILGSGPEMDPLKSQSNELGVSNQVTFAGFVSEQEKIDWLAAADLYVSTSQHEGFGLVFLEAMAQGLPVICYDNGGQTDYLEDGVNGRVLPLNDFDSFVVAVIELTANPEKRTAMSERNRTEVQTYFIENCADRYEKLFEQTIDSAG
jgi:glycosyltransferase involved in cell wall biosynthesis